MNETDSAGNTPPLTEAKYEASGNFPQLLDQLGASLLVSTYQAGKLLVLGTHCAELSVAFNHFDQAMGVAAGLQRIAVGARGQIWFLQNTAELAPRIEPRGRYDACYFTRSSHVTGEIHGHELAWVGDELWIVNTLFSCLCTIDSEFSFVPRWQPPFISSLAAEDRCHLNGLALDGGWPKFVTAMAESDTAGAWRPTKATSGCVVDVASGETVTRGLAMPHSPRVYNGRLFVLDSGHGRLSVVDPADGKVEPVAVLPGYTRGLSFHGPYAFVGLSRIRETSVFGGIPIAAEREKLKCGVAVVDLRTGQLVAGFYFESGVTEIFAVEVLPDVRCPKTTGPRQSPEEGPAIWYAPSPVPIKTQPSALHEHGNDSQAAELVRRGDDHRQQAEWSAAAACYRQALQLCPRRAQVAGKLGCVLHELGRHAEAAATFEQSLRIDPQQADVLMSYGSLLRDSARPDEARAMYERALEIEPENPFVHANLAQMLADEGDVDQAANHYAVSVRAGGVAKAKVAAAIMLPPVYLSMDDLHERRQRLIDNIAGLRASGFTMDPSREIIPHMFYPAYQGFNDRDLHRDFAALFVAPDPQAATPRHARNSDGRIHVGLISKFFCNHTIGRLNQGLVEKLDRKRFRLTVLSTALANDAIAQAFQQHADTYLIVPEHLPAARQQIADLGLDILLYADIGMSPFTYSLAFSRLAPVQCVTWGHPQTTGIPSIDYFLSGEHLETADGDAAYTEQLVRLRGLQTFYRRPVLQDPARDRDYFHLPASARLYGCPQSLFKFHPEFDDVLAGILRNDEQGILVLLEGKYARWTEMLRDRWRHVMPDVLDRARFLPRMPRGDFLHLNALCDVMLDPLHFGGGNTSFEALALGTPVVTLPSQFARGRITYAQYQLMGIDNCIVHSCGEYVQLANRLANDTEFTEQTSRKILESCGVLFENEDNIRAMEEFFESVVAS